MKADDLTGRLTIDVQAAQDLKYKLRQTPKEGLHVAAQQFEALFLQMVLKSMRDATPQDGLFDSDQTRLYTSLLDQQVAQNIAAKGSLGFARMIEQQLGRYTSSSANPTADPAAAAGTASQAEMGGVLNAPAAPNARPTATEGDASAAGIAGRRAAAPSPAANSDAAQASAAAPNAAARDFVARIWPHAQEASQATGIPASFLVAHAALESGWGRSEPRRSDGGQSYNLFGVKAGRNWQGATLDAQTTEYAGGQPQTVRERFRAYGSYAEAFRDYARLLAGNPRFNGVLGQQDGTAFASGLQQAGYATDPMYADKLARIINGNTLRQALIG